MIGRWDLICFLEQGVVGVVGSSMVVRKIVGTCPPLEHQVFSVAAAGEVRYKLP